MHDSRSDEDLMRAFQRGDARAFEILYQRHRLVLHGYLARQLGDAAIAEDLFQETWMTLIRQGENWQPVASLRTFLFRIARSRLVDHRRAQGRRGEALSLDDDDAPELACPAADATAGWQQRATAAALQRCLAALPAAQREAFLFSEERGFTLADIAAITGATAEAVKSRIRYAIDRLRGCLAGHVEVA